jgi:hypothetical protein
MFYSENMPGSWIRRQRPNATYWAECCAGRAGRGVGQRGSQLAREHGGLKCHPGQPEQVRIAAIEHRFVGSTQRVLAPATRVAYASITSRFRRGWPAQFILMWLKIRYSTGFHLEARRE